MKSDIDSIVADICAADPELAKDETFVRSLVSELTTKQPTVTADPAFRARLRNELLARAASHTTRTTLPWWFIYTVPVGVTVLLLLLVKPDLSGVPSPIAEHDALAPTTVSLKVDDSADSALSTTALTGPDMSAKSAPVASDFFTATLDRTTQTIVIGYASLTQAGFIVVTDPTGITATSTLLLPGEYEHVTLRATTPIESGVLFTATLYYDDGDATYTDGADIIARDPRGEPIAVPLVSE